MTPAPTAGARFTGFPPAALTFLAGLEADNSKAWFDAHRDVYEEAVRDPLERLIAEAGALYGPSKVFRPNRDVRFSRDKSPYKTTAAGYAGEVGVVYAALDPRGLHVGGGLYEPARDQLARARAAIATDHDAGAQLAEILETLRASGFTITGPSLRTAPKGYPKDHPRIELLRLQRFAALRQLPPGPDIHDPERSRAAIFGAWRALEPLTDWIRTHVGPSSDRR
ncbi:MAG: hypothetical protein AVDCRST_MAG79-1013 [uncultured Thermoleophilia bacterium]|uniref:TIGR02453 family protein n=1 Tax=uncultured Thermoleophilia bacterium TaxID=1497501 RepID=A0A6J4TUK8_9ACTN|nr:MAG: hypothetical protein AVDCRST_MAG79-1013 [uncultured Thermoleophilia bacterium]